MNGRTAVNPYDSTYVSGPPSVNGGNNLFTPAVGRNQTSVRSMEPHADQIHIVALEYDKNLE